MNIRMPKLFADRVFRSTGA